MKVDSQLVARCGSVLAVAALAGCATGASTSSGMSGMDAGRMDMQAMCEKHKGMMAGKSTAEQQAMMNEHMRSMSPEMQARMRAMHEQCQGS